MSKKITISSALTITDWVIKSCMEKFNGINDNTVRYVLTRCKEFGMKRIYWRTFDAGFSTYNSKLAEKFAHDKHDDYYQYSEGWIPKLRSEEVLSRKDFGDYDSLEAAVRIGHELGLEIYGWISINEDDHGFGFKSKFTREHPEFRWVRRNGFRYYSQLSFAFKEVREYKLGLVKEILEYNIDGLFLDWTRTGDIRDNPQTDPEGFADCGYETPNIELFKELYGIDPKYVPNSDSRWIDVRSRPITEFMRDVRKVAKNKKIIAMTWHPYSYRGILQYDFTPETEPWLCMMKGHTYAGSKEGVLCDIQTWASEKLVDAITLAGNYVKDSTPEQALNYLDKMVGDKVEKHAYFWIPDNVGKFEKDVMLAQKYNIDEILLWEADYIDEPAPELRQKIAEDVKKFI